VRHFAYLSLVVLSLVGLPASTGAGRANVGNVTIGVARPAETGAGTPGNLAATANRTSAPATAAPAAQNAAPSPVTWQSLIASILAGGIAGQLVTTFGGAWIARRGEHRKWLTTERQKVFSELLTIATHKPKTPDDLDKWTYRIRDASQRMHILFEEGTAPPDLADSVEAVFKLAQAKKDRTAQADWDSAFRDSVRAMRLAMASNLQGR